VRQSAGGNSTEGTVPLDAPFLAFQKKQGVSESRQHLLRLRIAILSGGRPLDELQLLFNPLSGVSDIPGQYRQLVVDEGH